MADLLLGAQHCVTVEEYREKMAELVETGRRHLNLKEVCPIYVISLAAYPYLLGHYVAFSSPPSDSDRNPVC